MKKYIVFIFLLLACGCTSTKKEKTYMDLMNEREYVIVDVRTKEEYDEGHVKDAINIPYDEIDESVDIDKNLLVFVYCKSGKRASIAYDTLKNMGYEVYNLGSFEAIDLEKVYDE